MIYTSRANPILAKFRCSPRNPSDFLWIIGSTASTEATYGVNESRHARRVLSRLASIGSGK